MESYNTNPAVFQVEPLDAEKTWAEIQTSATPKGWTRDGTAGAENPTGFLALRRANKVPQSRLYISAGIHGNEPAGPMALLELLKENNWPESIDVWMVPCLNPAGFLANRRENDQGIDLNVDYRSVEAEETKAHVAWLQEIKGPFDAALCLHENWETRGFYLSEWNTADQASFARKIISRVAEVCPIERASEIREMPANNGVIAITSGPEENEVWSEPLFLASQKARSVYTLMAPSNHSLSMRVNTLKKAVRAVLDGLKG